MITIREGRLQRGAGKAGGGETSGTGKGLRLTPIQGMHLLDVVMMMLRSQFHQPTCFWKWVGGTMSIKSGILSSEADPEKNTHCSSQDGHIIGTGNT